MSATPVVAAVALGLVLAGTACGYRHSAAPHAVPGVVGLRLDEAEDVLEAAGFDTNTHSLDGGPVIVRHFWAVCSQSRANTNTVDVFVSHDCSDYDSVPHGDLVPA